MIPLARIPFVGLSCKVQLKCHGHGQSPSLQSKAIAPWSGLPGRQLEIWTKIRYFMTSKDCVRQDNGSVPILLLLFLFKSISFRERD